GEKTQVRKNVWLAERMKRIPGHGTVPRGANRYFVVVGCCIELSARSLSESPGPVKMKKGQMRKGLKGHRKEGQMKKSAAERKCRSGKSPF
ncbi:MAG TPA: hypothetical protein VK641_08265, partial [Terriglobales bacterium]|nr:hypothetical protein [Terriglobales bacterium]